MMKRINMMRIVNGFTVTLLMLYTAVAYAAESSISVETVSFLQQQAMGYRV
ncbi:MAG: hypothetical protein GY801_26085 [bacterium]|nr:hypothetical protein [bacterium]